MATEMRCPMMATDMRCLKMAAEMRCLRMAKDMRCLRMATDMRCLRMATLVCLLPVSWQCQKLALPVNQKLQDDLHPFNKANGRRNNEC